MWLQMVEKHMQRIWFPHVSKFIRLVEKHENALAFLVQAVLGAETQQKEIGAEAPHSLTTWP